MVVRLQSGCPVLRAQHVSSQEVPPVLHACLITKESADRSLRKQIYFCTAAQSGSRSIVVFVISCKWFPSILTTCFLKHESEVVKVRESTY